MRQAPAAAEPALRYKAYLNFLSGRATSVSPTVFQEPDFFRWRNKKPTALCLFSRYDFEMAVSAKAFRLSR